MTVQSTAGKQNYDSFLTSLRSGTNRTFMLESIAVFLILVAFSSVGTPGINESHYLTKAKHFWNPEWCSGDLFLNSADAHQTFYVVLGWPLMFLSLDVLAWSGRILCWLGFSVVWVRLNRTLSIRHGFAPLTVALFVLLTERFDMAGEWVIGGFEAKSVSYIFVVWSLELFITRKWNWFWPVLGAAIAFHAVIGIWALFGLLAATAMTVVMRRKPSQLRSIPHHLKVNALPLTVFLLLVAAGCLPAISVNAHAAPEVIAAANEIQVHQRITHHLLFGSFETVHVARFGVLVALWLMLMQLVVWSDDYRRLNWFCTSSLFISLAGLVLSGLAEDQGSLSGLANSMLRFYWFRFSDFAIPLGLSIVGVRIGVELLNSNRSSKRIISLVCGVTIILASCLHIYELRRDSRPPADQASLPTYENEWLRTQQTFENWKKACYWIESNTPTNAVFITPLQQQTFKWYAQRAEFVCWKDAPQDAAGIVEWQSRIYGSTDIDYRVPGGFLGLNESQINQFTESSQVTHLIVPQSFEDAVFPEQENDKLRGRLTRVYPPQAEDRWTYVVYEISRRPISIDAATPEPSSAIPGSGPACGSSR